MTDKDIHRHLEEHGFPRDGYSEWFKCSTEDIQSALDTIKQRYINEDRRKELSQQFYEQLRNWFYWANEDVQNRSEHKDPDYALRIIVRLLLCFFLREKELVPREVFNKNFIDVHLKEDEYRYYTPSV